MTIKLKRFSYFHLVISGGIIAFHVELFNIFQPVLVAPVSETNPPVGKLTGIALCKSQAGLKIVTRASAAEAVECDFELGSTG